MGVEVREWGTEPQGGWGDVLVVCFCVALMGLVFGVAFAEGWRETMKRHEPAAVACGCTHMRE